MAVDRVMQVSLTTELEELVRRKLASGLYGDASEIVREALRLLAARDEMDRLKLERLRAALVAGESSGLVEAGRGGASQSPRVWLRPDTGSPGRRDRIWPRSVVIPSDDGAWHSGGRISPNSMPGMDLLVDHPQMGVAREDVRPGYRCLREGRRLIFYRARADTVEIVRILYQRIDVRRYLAGVQ